MVVHEEVLAPLRPGFGVVAKQHVVQPQPQQFLRREQRHTGLFGRAVTFTLVAFYARGNEICGSAFTALRTRENVIERQVLCVLMVAAVLTSVAVTRVDVDARVSWFTQQHPPIAQDPESECGVLVLAGAAAPAATISTIGGTAGRPRSASTADARRP